MSRLIFKVINKKNCYCKCWMTAFLLYLDCIFINVEEKCRLTKPTSIGQRLIHCLTWYSMNKLCIFSYFCIYFLNLLYFSDINIWINYKQNRYQGNQTINQQYSYISYNENCSVSIKTNRTMWNMALHHPYRQEINGLRWQGLKNEEQKNKTPLQ